MGVSNKQIGWSVESNLIWNALKELDKLNKVTGSSMSSIVASLATKITNEQGVPSFYSDTLVNIPPAGTVGRMFVSTDTFAFYRDNGIGWDLIGGPGTGTITGSGAAGQVAFWNGTTSQTGDAGLTYNSTTDILFVNGGIGVGSSSLLNSNLLISRNITGDTNVSSVLNNSIIQSDVTFAGSGFISQIGTQNFAFTLPLLRHFGAIQGSLGASSIVSNQYGFHASSSLIGATNNFGFRGEIPSGTGRWNLYMNGTANNYLAGNLLLNTLTDAGFRLDVAGSTRIAPPADTTGLTLSGYSLTGSSAVPAIDISGTWNTTGTPTLIRVNVTDTASAANSSLIDLRVGTLSRFSVRASDGAIFFGNYSTFPTISIRNSSGTFELRSSLQNVAGNEFIFGNGQTGVNKTTASGVTNVIVTQIGLSPTSGTAVLNGFVYNGTINQTGGANGITRGLFVDPTLTAAADWRSIEWSNSTGRGLWGTGTANNAMAGALHVGSATNANAAAILEITSTTRGVLFPRMTSAQRNAIATPPAGLVVYNTTDNRLSVFNGTGWVNIDTL